MFSLIGVSVHSVFYSQAIWQNRFYCRLALAEGLKKSWKKKALHINHWRREIFDVSAIATWVDC